MFASRASIHRATVASTTTKSYLFRCHATASNHHNNRRLRTITMASAATETAPAIATNSITDYDTLAKKLKDISSLSGISGLLGWDEMVMLPPGAAEARASQKSALASIIHEKKVDTSIGDLLTRLQSSDLSPLNDYQRATIREAARGYAKDIAVTEELVRLEAELESRGYTTWVKARQEKDFSLFAPVLSEWVAARKQRASLVDGSRPPYNVLADDYSPGLTAERITEVFDTVKEELVPFLARLRSQGHPPDASWLYGQGKKYDVEKQAALCKDIAVALGFDLSKGRLDVSVHPFTGGAHVTDVRMTTRFKEHDVSEGLTGAIHETGHALYEQGRNLEYDGLPVNSALGMAVHESQSLLWERMVGLSLPFAQYVLPKLKEAFPEEIPVDKSAEDLYAAFNVIRDPSLIRVEADEVTYPMHIILRFEIEKDLIEGKIVVDDIPRVWNDKMEQYLGVRPADDGQGCLQDVHWACGASFGYFPTYSLGAMIAVQLFAQAKEEIPGLEDEIAQGNFAPLKQWLNEKIHTVGSLYPTADELLVAVTGKPLDPQLFIDYLKEKYSKLYKLS